MREVLERRQAQENPAELRDKRLPGGQQEGGIALQIESVILTISSGTAIVPTPFGLVHATALHASVTVIAREVSISPLSSGSKSKEIIEVKATDPKPPLEREASQRQPLISLANEVSAIDRSAPMRSSSQASADQTRSLVEMRLNQLEMKQSTQSLKSTDAPQSRSEIDRTTAPVKSAEIPTVARTEGGPLASPVKINTSDAAFIKGEGSSISGAASSSSIKAATSESVLKNTSSNIEPQTTKLQDLSINRPSLVSTNVGITPQISAPPTANIAPQTKPLATLTTEASSLKGAEYSVKGLQSTTNSNSTAKQSEVNKHSEQPRYSAASPPSSGKDTALRAEPDTTSSIIQRTKLTSPKTSSTQTAGAKETVQDNIKTSPRITRTENPAFIKTVTASPTRPASNNYQARTNLANGSGKTLDTKPNLDNAHKGAITTSSSNSSQVNMQLSDKDNYRAPKAGLAKNTVDTPKIANAEAKTNSTKISANIIPPSKAVSELRQNITGTTVPSKSSISFNSVQVLRTSVAAGIENLKNLLSQTNIPSPPLIVQAGPKSARPNISRASDSAPNAKDVGPVVASAIKGPQSLFGRNEANRGPLNRDSDAPKGLDSSSHSSPRAAQNGAHPLSSGPTSNIGASRSTVIISNPLAGLSNVLDGLSQAAQSISGVELLKKIEGGVEKLCQTVIALAVAGTIGAERIVSYIAANVGEILGLMRNSEAQGLDLPDDINQLIEGLVNVSRIDAQPEDAEKLSSLTHEANESASVADIVGIVTDEASGVPLKGVEIDGFNLGKVYTDEQGIFIIRNVPIGDNYRIVPLIKGWGFNPSELLGKCSLLNFHQFVGNRDAE
jgi:hypothetical protein